MLLGPHRDKKNSVVVLSIINSPSSDGLSHGVKCPFGHFLIKWKHVLMLQVTNTPKIPAYFTLLLLSQSTATISGAVSYDQIIERKRVWLTMTVQNILAPVAWEVPEGL